MKSNIFKSMAVVAVAIFAGYNVYQSNVNNEEMSSIVLENIEALADEENEDVIKVCPTKGGTCTIQIGEQVVVGAVGWQK